MLKPLKAAAFFDARIMSHFDRLCNKHLLNIVPCVTNLSNVFYNVFSAAIF